MLLNELKDLGERARERSRTVIIGGSTVGLYAARELDRRGQNVLVIESGGVGLDGFAPASYSSVGKTHEGIRLGRSKSLGGTSNLWGGQLVEFQPIDFEGRDWLADSKWPVPYSEISPYYRPTYENLGISESVTSDLRILTQIMGSKPHLDEGLEVFLTRWLKIPSFAVSYAKEIQTSKSFAVLLNHTVVGFAGSNGSITAVRAADHTGRIHVIAGEEFILAAGTIEICRLLLHSAAALDWDCPWRHNANIGTCFQDHLVGRVASLKVLDARRFFSAFSTIVWSGHKFQPKIRLTNEALRRCHILNIQGMMSFESSIGENLVYLKQFLKAALYSRKFSGVGDLVKNLGACGKYLLPLMWKYVVDNRIFVPGTSKISLIVQSEQSPLRDSRIFIDPAVPDASGLSKVILDWRVGGEEATSIRKFTLHCAQALRSSGLAELEIAEDVLNSESRLLDRMRDNYHHAGGARMAVTEKDGVVDRDLRVFGTANLYVAGAASFRTTGNANTTFTALAFVTRLVDYLSSHSPLTADCCLTQRPRTTDL